MERNYGKTVKSGAGIHPHSYYAKWYKHIDLPTAAAATRKRMRTLTNPPFATHFSYAHETFYKLPAPVAK